MVKEGKRDEAKKILEKADSKMIEQNFPYGMPSKYGMHNQTSFKFLLAAYLAKDDRLIAKVSRSLKNDLAQEIRYFNSLSPERQASYGYEIQGSLNVQQMSMLIDQLANIDKPQNPLQQLENGDSSMLKKQDSAKK